MTLGAEVYELIEGADLNGLLRVIDSLCSRRRWDDLLDLANACEEAVERGKQLWPIAAHADYRIALEAPGDIAAEVLTGERTKFGPGPLTEVAASTHAWAELGPHIESPVAAAYVAQERVLRGEALDDEPDVPPEVLELPLHIEGWEPSYALATYGANHVEVAEPWEPSRPWRDHRPSAAEELEDAELVAALLDLVHPWVAESNGAARAIVVEGDAAAAAGSLTMGVFRTTELDLDAALRELAWAAASGGAHGMRRGAAFGRFAAWYTAAIAADCPWPAAPDLWHEAVSTLRWHRWDEPDAPDEGWKLRLVVESPEGGWAAAISATDALLEEEEAPA